MTLLCKNVHTHIIIVIFMCTEEQLKLYGGRYSSGGVGGLDWAGEFGMLDGSKIWCSCLETGCGLDLVGLR
jgi:hypothetical protein